MRGRRARKFAAIKPGIWESRKFRDGSVHAKLVAIYLMSNPHYLMVGIYRLPLYFVMKDTGLSDEMVQSALQELIELGFCRYDDVTEVVWVEDMALSQVSERPNAKQQVGVLNELARLHFDHEYPFVQEFMDKYRARYSFLPESLEELLGGDHLENGNVQDYT